MGRRGGNAEHSMTAFMPLIHGSARCCSIRLWVSSTGLMSMATLGEQLLSGVNDCLAQSVAQVFRSMCGPFAVSGFREDKAVLVRRDESAFTRVAGTRSWEFPGPLQRARDKGGQGESCKGGRRAGERVRPVWR